MTNQEVWRFLEDHRVMNVATVGEAEMPHNTPIWYLIKSKKIYFRAQPYKKKILNIKSNPNVSCLVEDGRKYSELRGVSIQGAARIIEEQRVREIINEGLKTRYSKERDYGNMPEQWRAKFLKEKRAIVEVTPKRILSWDNRKWKVARKTSEDLK